MAKRHTRRFLVLLVVLLLLDLVFIGLHLGYELADSRLLTAEWLLDPALSLEEEGTFGNLYQHAKQLAIVALLVVTLVRTRKLIYAWWIVIFTFILLDDVLLLHEQVGNLVADIFELPMVNVLGGIMPNDYLEFVFLASMGALLLVPLLLILRNSGRRERLASLYYLLGAFFLFTFGAFFDQLDRTALSYSITGMTSLLLAIEESGELLVFSPLLVYSLFLAVHMTPPEPPFKTHPGTFLDRLLGEA